MKEDFWNYKQTRSPFLQTKDSVKRIAIYLTFDDGTITESRYIDSIVHEDSIKINVFLIGQKVFACKEAQETFYSYKKDSLIEIGNHSFSHANNKYKSYYKNLVVVVNDVLINQDTLHLTNKIVRMPGRNAWRVNNRCQDDLTDVKPSADSLAKIGYTVFGWDLEWRYDSAAQDYYSTDQMIRKIASCKTGFTAGNIVILCHDMMLANMYFRSQLQLFIKKIKADSNYYFEHVSNYPK